VDSKLKPWLLEVNYTPSFRTDTPIDLKIKRGVIKDALTLINVDPKKKKAFLAMEREKLIQRSMYGKTYRLSVFEKIIL
jgi:tubulin polyglutamylase TTLL6/13